MPNTRSAKKRLRQSQDQRVRNRSHKSALKTQVKRFQAAVSEGNADAARREYVLTTKALDQAAAENLIHKNVASRNKSRLAKQLAKVTGESA